MENSQEKLDKNIRDNMLARLGVTKPYLVFSLIAVVLILGIFSVTKFKTELFPNMNLPYVVVSYGPQRTLDEGEPYTADGKANYKPLQWVKSTYIVDDTDPENIEYGYNYYNPNLLTEPTERFTSLVENYLQMAQGVKNIDSMSIANGSIIIFIEFNSGIDADTAVAQVNQAIGRVDYTRPFNNSPAFHSSISFSQPIVQKISMDMMPVFAFTSTYLADLDLTNPVNQYKVQSFYANLASELAKAGGVAMISSSLEDPEGNQFTKLNNKNAFSFRLQKASDAVTTETVANIISILNNIKRDSMALDATNYFDYDVTLDQAETINESIGSVLNNLLMGALFAIIILFLFLRSWKMTLAVAISIPFSIVCTFIAMYFMGIGLNVISMSALALVIGMLVDNAIIILENIFRLRSKGLPIKEAAIKGASQILMAAFASTLTTICVFFPMFFVQGLIMEIFMDLVWVIILALGASLLVSIMFLPSIITTFRLGEKPQHKFKPLVATTNFIAKVDAKITKAFSKPKNWVTRAYDKTLKFCIKWKWATICVATLLFAASTLLVFFGNGFVLMPAMDSGEFSMTIGLNRAYKESGSTLNEHGISQKANGLSTEIYNELKTSLGSGNIKNIAVSYSTGSGMSALFSAGQTNLDVNIVLTNNRKLTTAEATEKAYTTVVGFLSSDAKHLFPKDDQDFDSEAHFVSSVSTSASMTMMAADNVVVTLAAPANPEPTVSDVGKTQSEIAQERLGDALELIYNELKAMNDAGILRITNSYSPYLIQKTNKRIMGSIDITIAQGHTVSKVQSRVDAKVNELFNTHKNTELKGITQVSDGFSSQFAETFTQMGAALIIGLILIYLIMVAMFASFKMPLIVLTTIPLAFTGGFALLAMAGMPMSIPAMVGLIMLMGVIVNNGIVLIDYINQARSDGLKISDAVIAGATVRARPIIMTALTTIIALIPLALGLGKGSSGAMMQPLAIVSIGGMTYAMLMSLLVVPAFYCIMHFKKMKKENQNEKINSSQLENEQNKGGDTQLLQGVRGKKSKV